MVNGKIYIHLEREMQGKDINVIVEGEECVSFWHTVKRGKHSKREKKKVERKILDFRGKCYSFTQPLAPGDYVLDFEIQLPLSMPASIWYKDYNHHDKPKAKILYHCHVELETHAHEILKYK